MYIFIIYAHIGSIAVYTHTTKWSSMSNMRPYYAQCPVARPGVLEGDGEGWVLRRGFPPQWGGVWGRVMPIPENDFTFGSKW